MSKKKAVTTAQLEHIRKMAGDKGITSEIFQRGLDDGSFGAMLDTVKEAVLNPVLKFICTMPVPAMDAFVAADHFTKDNKKVKFWGFGENFTKNFLGKREKAVVATTLAIHSLRRSSRDEGIRKELSPKHIITLGQFYKELEAQGNGEAGPLLTNGYANIAYIEDEFGTVWAVCAHWYAGGGWCVIADSVGDPGEWGADSRVLSQVS